MTGTATGTAPQQPSVVVLAKDTHAAKSRLQLPRDEARRVALHLAATTVRAALAAETVGAVLVVTGDADIARDAHRAGADVVTEPHPLGINRAAALGRRRALAARPTSPVAILVADLPNLSPSDLDAAVTEFHVTGHSLFVADHLGVGTTLLIHPPDRRPGIGFGRHSAAMHRRLGYREARTAPPGLRTDLDNREDLKRLGRQLLRR